MSLTKLFTKKLIYKVMKQLYVKISMYYIKYYIINQIEKSKKFNC